MRLRIFPAICALLLGIATLAVVPARTLATNPSHVASAPDSKTVSGTISSIGDASFTVDVKHDRNIVPMQFLIDDATQFDGKLVVGAQATVQFRTADRNNIATHVHVSVRPGGGQGLP